MKFWTTFLLLICTIAMIAQSQSRTYEISPTFHKDDLEHLSDVVDFNRSFDDISFVGISAYHFDPDYKDIKYRIHQRGKWSSWRTLSPQHETTVKVRTAYEGQFINSSFTALQFKTSDILVTPLTIRLFVGKKQKTEEAVQERSNLCIKPDFCDRACWCSDCPIDTSPKFTSPTHIIVHHSAGSNDPNLNFTEVVNYIWDLHVNTNGWDDIGYNWLIDPNGVIYEGRPDDYQGAHFSCINENTIGICLLGTFTLIPPTDEAKNALVNLAAYEATDQNIDVLGESYHETGQFFLTNIAGHRDSSGSTNSCSSTACPGNAFYPMLDSIRIKVADLACYQNNVSAIEDITNEHWSIFPNPFQNSLMIKHRSLSHSKIEIKDITGRTLGMLFTNQLQDMSYLTNGIYFIVHDGQVVKKVIKQQ